MLKSMFGSWLAISSYLWGRLSPFQIPKIVLHSTKVDLQLLNSKVTWIPAYFGSSSIEIVFSKIISVHTQHKFVCKWK